MLPDRKRCAHENSEALKSAVRHAQSIKLFSQLVVFVSDHVILYNQSPLTMLELVPDHLAVGGCVCALSAATELQCESIARRKRSSARAW